MIDIKEVRERLAVTKPLTEEDLSELRVQCGRHLNQPMCDVLTRLCDELYVAKEERKNQEEMEKEADRLMDEEPKEGWEESVHKKVVDRAMELLELRKLKDKDILLCQQNGNLLMLLHEVDKELSSQYVTSTTDRLRSRIAEVLVEGGEEWNRKYVR